MEADPSSTQSYCFGPFRIEPLERRLLRDDVRIPLTPKAFDLLIVLVENAGQLLEKDALMKRIWTDAFVEEANLANNISLLRKTLGEGNDSIVYIETVPRRGYRFLAKVEKVSSPVHSAATPQVPALVRRVARIPRRFAAALFAVLLLVLAVANSMLRISGPAPTPHTVRFPVAAPPGTSLPPPFEPVSPALSPDGTRIVFRVLRNGEPMLAIRAIDGLDATVLGNTEGARFPFWSPDGEAIGFFADGKLKRLSASGGPVRTICSAADGYGGTWNSDDMILFAPGAKDGLFKVSASGGEPTQITWLQQNETFHQHPQFLPDGRHFIFFASPDRIYLGSLESGMPVRILTSRSQARYSPPGYLVFVQDHVLVAQQFDTVRARLVGDPVPIGVDVPIGGAFAEGRPAGGGGASVSENGVLAYRTIAPIRAKLVYFDRNGKLLSPIRVLPFDRFSDAELSPDGTQLAVASGAHDFGEDIWVVDLATGRSTQLTFNPAQDRRPVWSSDAHSLVFTSGRTEAPGIYQKKLTGEQPEEILVQSDARQPVWPSDFGARGVVYATAPRGPLWLVPPGAGHKPRLLADVGRIDAKISPDGNWLAYSSDESAGSGRPDVYVQSLSTRDVKYRISTPELGGSLPRWRSDGKELFYLGGDNSVMAVRIHATAMVLRPALPERLFNTTLNTMPEGLRSFGVVPDGQRFLISMTDDGVPTQSLVVVANWQSGLGR